jgi:hypothetical protein
MILAHSTILNNLYVYPEATGVFLGRNLLVVDVKVPKIQQGNLRTTVYRLDYPFAVVYSEDLF